MTDDLFVVIGATLLSGAVEQTLDQLVVVGHQQQNAVNLLALGFQDGVELVHLCGVAGVAIQQESVGDVALIEAGTHHVVGDRVGNQVAGVDVRLRFLTELGLFLNVLAEDIASGDGGNLQRFSNLDGLGALTGTGRANDEQTVHRSNPS